MTREWHLSNYCLFCIAILLFAAGNSAWAETVSREARKHMNRGMAATEMANSPADYEEAIREFEQAVRFAPDWPAPYFNLGYVQNEVGKYQKALDSYRQYLELAPNAPDTVQVQAEIDQIEYRLEKASVARQKEERIKKKYSAVLGRWQSMEYRREGFRPATLNYEIRLRNGQLMVGVWGEYGEDINRERLVPAKLDGTILTFHFGCSSVPSDFRITHGYNDWRELDYTIAFPPEGIPEGHYVQRYTDFGYHGFGDESERVKKIRSVWKRWESAESDGMWWWDRSDQVPIANP